MIRPREVQDLLRCFRLIVSSILDNDKESSKLLAGHLRSGLFALVFPSTAHPSKWDEESQRSITICPLSMVPPLNAPNAVKYLFCFVNNDNCGINCCRFEQDLGERIDNALARAVILCCRLLTRG
jgi:hypothetical protein